MGKKLTKVALHPLYRKASDRGFSIGYYWLGCSKNDEETITLAHPANFLTEEELESEEGKEWLSLIHDFVS